MASMQLHKPADHQNMASANCKKPKSETCHSGNNANEHRFSTKVKEMASSVTKVFTEHKQHGNKSNYGEKKDGHCLPRMGGGGDHNYKKKKEKHDMKTKIKNKDGKSRSRSSSSSDSDN